jgi:hypothetical protein
MDMRFGSRNVRSLYRAGSRRTVVEEISKYKLDLVEVQEVRWDRGGTKPAGEYTFLGGTKVVCSTFEWLEFWKLERWPVVEGPEVQL